MRKERLLYLAILLGLGILAITVFRNDYNLQTIETRRYWINKTFSREKSDVLFAGDSRIYRGISPEVFEHESPGRSAFNLGYSSNGFHPDYLDFVKSRLDTTASQPVIVLGISSTNFSRRESKSEHYHRERFDRKREEVVIYMYFYDYLKTFTPMDLSIVLGIRTVNPFKDNYKSIYHMDGWCESYWETPDSTYTLKYFQDIPENSRLDSANLEILLNRVREWTDEGIVVFAYRSPSTYAIRQVEDSISGLSYPPFIHEMEDRGAHWIDVDRSRYESYDGNHLERESARKLTADLAHEINLVLDSLSYRQTN